MSLRRYYFTFLFFISLFTFGQKSDISEMFNYELQKHSIIISLKEGIGKWPKKLQLAERFWSTQTSSWGRYRLQLYDWDLNIITPTGKKRVSLRKNNSRNLKIDLNPEDKLEISTKENYKYFVNNIGAIYSKKQIECIKRYYPNFSYSFVAEEDRKPYGTGTGIIIGKVGSSKSFKLYKLKHSTNLISHYLRLKLKFVDFDSETPVHSKIYLDYNVKPLPNKHSDLIIKSGFCNPFKKRSLEFYNEILSNQSQSKEFLEGVINIFDKILNKYVIEITARTSGRTPLKFTINGGREFNEEKRKELKEEYIIKWPRLPIDVNISETKSVKPEIIRTN